MIIFYHKQTGEIFGTVDGRVHSDYVLKNVVIKPNDIPDEDIGKFIVPMEKVYEEVEQPMTEWRMVDQKTKKVEEVQIGTQKVKQVKELLPTTAFRKEILQLEKREKRLRDFKIQLHQGEVVKLIPK